MDCEPQELPRFVPAAACFKSPAQMPVLHGTTFFHLSVPTQPHSASCSPPRSPRPFPAPSLAHICGKYICTHIHISIVCVCVCICIHTHTHTHTHRFVRLTYSSSPAPPTEFTPTQPPRLTSPRLFVSVHPPSTNLFPARSFSAASA